MADSPWLRRVEAAETVHYLDVSGVPPTCEARLPGGGVLREWQDPFAPTRLRALLREKEEG